MQLRLCTFPNDWVLRYVNTIDFWNKTESHSYTYAQHIISLCLLIFVLFYFCRKFASSMGIAYILFNYYSYVLPQISSQILNTLQIKCNIIVIKYVHGQ